MPIQYPTLVHACMIIVLHTLLDFLYLLLHLFRRKIRGLTDSRQHFEIVFHVIIPKPHWEWDKTSRVFLRFGCEELGSWNLNIGLFQERYL